MCAVQTGNEELGASPTCGDAKKANGGNSKTGCVLCFGDCQFNWSY